MKLKICLASLAFLLSCNFLFAIPFHIEKDIEFIQPSLKKHLEKKIGRKLKWKERIILKIVNKKKTKKGISKYLKEWLTTLLIALLVILGGLMILTPVFSYGIPIPLWQKITFAGILGLFVFVLTRPVKQQEKIPNKDKDPFIFEPIENEE